MTDPAVCCVMLTRDRTEYARRAVECFRAQTYENKRLVILDTGEKSYDLSLAGEAPSPICHWREDGSGKTVGALRNRAAVLPWAKECDIIIHFDDDDWSHQNRIAEQVALLQTSGAECVGYREMLFWDSTKCMIEIDPSRVGPDGVGCMGTVKSVGEVWLYSVPSSSWLLGSSYCYWRHVWERRPFPDLPKMKDGKAIPDSSAEDTIWKREVKCMGVPSGMYNPQDYGVGYRDPVDIEPRMICRIHGRNTTDYSQLLTKKYENTWKRVPEWDEHCRRIMQ